MFLMNVRGEGFAMLTELFARGVQKGKQYVQPLFLSLGPSYMKSFNKLSQDIKILYTKKPSEVHSYYAEEIK